ncbi:MAG: GWxTD domain-containing protein [Bacteroidota bacterium]
MNVKSGSQSRIDIYIQISFHQLRFEKTPAGFKAKYTLAYIIKKEKGDIVQTRDGDREITTGTYEESVSSRFDGTLQSFILDPGRYAVEIISTDNNSALRYRYNEQINVRGFNSSGFKASDMLFLDTVIANARSISLTPIVPSAVSTAGGSLGIFQELYNVTKGDTVRVIQTYSAVPTFPNDSVNFNYFTPPYKTGQHLCDMEYSDMYFIQDSSLIIEKEGTEQLIQFYPPLRPGSSLAERLVIRGNDTLRFHQAFFRHIQSAGSIVPMDELTDAMRYIMREEEYDTLLTTKKNISSVPAFWQDRGGRQRMVEFQKRVSEADKLFTSCIEGSRTPMGISYIVCGTPDYVDCRSPYFENWYYTVGERSYAIQFRRTNERDDMAAFALVPFSVNEQLWQYYIDQWRKKSR